MGEKMLQRKLERVGGMWSIIITSIIENKVLDPAHEV
jgi:hypothetical protein